MHQLTKYLFLLIPLYLLFSCDHKSQKKQTEDFTTLMGSNKGVWQFVKTHEDLENMRFFQTLYEKNKELFSLQQEALKIPQVIHFIWLGPKPFPKESIEKVCSWVELHPECTFKFWTDRRRPLPHHKMEFKEVSKFCFSHLGQCFEESDNYGEKSDLLRYEILYHEGGLYVDHDVHCFKALTPFHYQFDLFCGLEPPHPPVLSSSISVCNNLIGARAHHPILKACIDLVKKRWVEIGNAYPGTDKESIIYRVAQRSFASFDDAVRKLLDKGDDKNIAFPAAYFNQIEGDPPRYAHHSYASTWFEDETKFEKKVRRQLVAIARKNNQVLLFNAAILTANLLLFAFLFVQYQTIRKEIKKRDTLK